MKLKHRLAPISCTVEPMIVVWRMLILGQVGR